MSECRCYEKQECRAKIQALESAAGLWSGLSDRFAPLTGSFIDLRRWTDFTYEGDNRECIAPALSCQDDDIRVLHDHFASAISARMEALEKEYADLEAEDDDYHTPSEEELPDKMDKTN